MTPDALAALRDSLPVWGMGECPAALLDPYCEFYGLQLAGAGASHQVGTVASGTYRLAVQRWQQPGARGTLLLVHGYMDHVGLFAKLIEFGLSLQCNVLAFDLPGHGLSSGEPMVIEDFRDYGEAIVDVLRAVKPTTPLWVIGQSTGCSALISFAGIHRWPFVASVLLAPLVRPKHWLAIRLAHGVLGSRFDWLPRRFNQNSSDLQFVQFIQGDPLQTQRLSVRWIGALKRWLGSLPDGQLGVGPALVIQGEKDGTVDWRYNIKVIGRLFPGSRVEYLPDAGHHLANESEQIRQRYFRWVEDYLEGCIPAAANSSTSGSSAVP